MPVLFIDSSADPELETWMPAVRRAAAQTVAPPCSNLSPAAVQLILESEIPSIARPLPPALALCGRPVHRNSPKAVTNVQSICCCLKLLLFSNAIVAMWGLLEFTPR